MPIPVAARSKASVCGRSLAGILASNPTGGMDISVVLYKDTRMDHEGQKDLKVQNGSKEKTGQGEKKSRCGRNFSQPSRLALGPTQSPVQLVTSPFTGVKAAGGGVDHPTPSSAEVKERVELYLYSPSGTSWPVVG